MVVLFGKGESRRRWIEVGNKSTVRRERLNKKISNDGLHSEERETEQKRIKKGKIEILSSGIIKLRYKLAAPPQRGLNNSL